MTKKRRIQLGTGGMIRKKHRVQFILEEAEYQQLKLRAERQYRSISNYVKRAVSSEVRKHAPSARKINKSLKALLSGNSEESLVILMRGDKPGEGYIYFIQEVGTNFVKIGYSKDPYQRIKGMATDNPHDLELLAIIPGSQVLERKLHELLNASLHSGEWFILTDQIFQIISAAKSIGESLFYVEKGRKVKLSKNLVTHVGKSINRPSGAILNRFTET